MEVALAFHLDLEVGSVTERHHLWPDLHIRNTVPSGPLGHPHHAVLVLGERELTLRSNSHHNRNSTLEVNFLLQGARRNCDPVTSFSIAKLPWG